MWALRWMFLSLIKKISLSFSPLVRRDTCFCSRQNSRCRYVRTERNNMPHVTRVYLTRLESFFYSCFTPFRPSFFYILGDGLQWLQSRWNSNLFRGAIFSREKPFSSGAPTKIPRFTKQTQRLIVLLIIWGFIVSLRIEPLLMTLLLIA